MAFPASSAPPQPTASKRDKRRTALADKLNELTASFSQNRDSHYRAQLQALQIDMQLVLSADPYRHAPLDDSGDDVAEMVQGAIASTSAGAGAQIGPRRYEGDMAALAGRWYMQYVEDVNNCCEEKDAQLTQLENKYERALQEIHNTNRYKIRLAQEEHAILSRTLRDRLIQSIGEKKKRLLREKDHLDIADSNALLLHPSQFSITNPASPGGAQNNRKTRHTRLRPGEVEDMVTGLNGVEVGHKRRKKALDEDVGSPGPSGRVTEGGTASPYRDAKARLVAAQFEAPLYSIDKLFTEKELGLHLNTAAVAAANFFAAEKAQQSLNGASRSGNGVADEGHVNGDTQDLEGDEDIPADAPEMDRAANASHHATRSTRNNGATALNLLGDLAVSEKNNAPSIPVLLPSSVITKTGEAPIAPRLNAESIQEDLQKIAQFMQNPGGSADQKLLDDLTMPAGVQSGNQLPSMGSIIANATATAASAVQTAMGTGGVPMSTQSSMAGFSDPDVVAMRRDEGSSMGSMMMKRTASGAGFGVSEGGKRIRNR